MRGSSLLTWSVFLHTSNNKIHTQFLLCKHTYIPLPLYYILRLQSMRLTALLPIGQHQFSFNGLPFTSILLYTYASRYWKSDFIKILDPIFRQDRYFIITIVLYNCDVIFRTTIHIIYYIVLFSGKSIGNDVMVFKLNIGLSHLVQISY